mgnify:CR=1 FL=1
MIIAPEPVYGLNNLIDDINHNESGLAAIYNKDEFRNILASFYEGGELSGVETILVELDIAVNVSIKISINAINTEYKTVEIIKPLLFINY